MTSAANAELLALAVSVAREAAALAARRRSETVTVAATKSSPVDVVTATDREVEALIRGRLRDARPSDGFLGEESGSGSSASGLHWIVDPIDGTVNFLYGIPHYAVSIAVSEGADPASWSILAGCVVNPASGELFAAARGEGATLDGRAVAVSAPASLGESLVATGFGYDARVRDEQGATVMQLLSRVRDIRRMGAAALDLCSIAVGRLDAYFERGLNPWDFAAGALIASEAGAVVTTDDVRDGRRLVMAAAPSIAREFAELLRDTRA